MTESVPLDVKWNKESFKIDFVVADGVQGLKNELEEKTGVPGERMKLMAKSKGLWKGVLKDDADLSKIDFAAALAKANGKDLQVLLMGSAEKLKEKKREEAKLPPAKPKAKLPPKTAATNKEDTKPAASTSTSTPTGGSKNAPIPTNNPDPAKQMSDPDERTAYQTTEAWLKQSPPGFLYPKVVPSIVGLRDLVQQPLPPTPQGEEEISLATPKRGKEVLSAALQNLEGLDKEEANLILASPWTVPLTQIVTGQPAANPQQALEQLQACGSASPRKVCQYPFKKNDMVVMCRTCQADETCAMCHECFNLSNHEGHDVQFFQAQEGGCCDCGDPEAWDPNGFCPNHGEQCRPAPPRRAVCQKPFKKNDMIYMCTTCQADETCAMCHECFNNSNHEGHDVKIFPSPEGGGCCDCGDVDAWDPSGFCPNHGPPNPGEGAANGASPQAPEDLLPPGLVTRVKGMVPAIMDWMVNEFVETAKAATDRTMLPATTAETILGALGRQGHGLYLVVQADDVHQPEYVDALRQFLGSSSYYDDNVMRKLAQTLTSVGQLVLWGTMELASECGRDQTRAWIQDGDPYTSSTIASVMVQRVFDLKRRGLYCRIMTLKELQQEQQAIAIIQWVSALAFSCDPLCQTVATYIDTQRHLVPLLKADFILSGRFTKAWYSLLLNLLSVPAFKSNLGAAYCDTYEQLTEDCAKGKGVLERSAYSLSVQFLNRDTYVLDLVANRDLLSKLGKALLATLKAAEDRTTKTLKPNHVVLSHRRYSPCISDLNYVINVKGMKRLISCKNGTFLKDLLAGLSLAQCIDTHSWRHWDLGHVEEEDLGWYGAFNLSITLGGLFERILSFDDSDMSPVQDPSSPYFSGLLTSAELSYQVLVSGLEPWQRRATSSLQPTSFSSAVDSHRRKSASLPYSTIAAKHGTTMAFRQLSVSQANPFSLHLPLHRFFAACIRELCLRPDWKGIRSLLERLSKNQPKAELDNMYHGLISFPILVLSRAAQVRAGLWRRNGPGLNEQVIKYSDPTFCRSMRDSDLALVQLAVIFRSMRESPTPRPGGDVDVAAFVHLLLHRLGLFDFAGLSRAPNADPNAYEAEVSKGLYPGETGEDNGGKAGLVFPWTYTPARDASDCRALVEELLYFLVVFATELPQPPPADKDEHTHQAKMKLRREVIHRLAASPKTHSELSDIHLVLSFRENTLLNEVGKSINPDDATAAMLGQILADVAERKASRSRLEPDKFVLLKSAWGSYDPSFFHLSVEGHQTAAESRPVPTSKDESANGTFGPTMSYAPALPKAHPCFARLRRDISADATVLTVAFRILHMHCRGSQRSDLVDLKVGRLAYENDAKSETSLARAVHLLTLGCFAWEDAKEGNDEWREKGGGSPGSIFYDRETAPTAKDWIAGAFLSDPKDLMDCSWYAGEENTLLLLKKLAVDGGTSGIFVVQDPAVQAGAAWICDFAVKHCPEAANLVDEKGESSEGVEKNESEMDKRKRIAKEKALARMNAQASKFADMMQVELKENGEDENGAGTSASAKQETDFERRKREAKEKALARINNQAMKFASAEGIAIDDKKSEASAKSDESDFERKKRLAKEKALAKINSHAAKFASSVGLDSNAEEKVETETEKRKRMAKEKALAKMNAEAAKFASFMDIELDKKEGDGGDGLKAPASGSAKADSLRKESPQCIICSDSDAECFVAFSQGSTTLKGGGGPSSTGDQRMKQVRKHVGAHIALCGHAMHNDCSASYLAKVQQNEDQASGRHGEFRCPLCQRPSNCLVPYIDASVDWIGSPTCLPVNSNDNRAPDLNTFLTTTPWWVSRRRKDTLWDGQGSFRADPAGDNNQVKANDQVSGEVVVFKTLMEHLSGITYETDSKRLGEEHLAQDLGEFRHYLTERHFYQKSETDSDAWPACLFPDQQLPDSQVPSFSREKFISQLLMSIQTLVYSTSCELFDARRNIADNSDPSTKGKAAAAPESDALKPILSKFGISGVACEGQLILMPTPSATEDDGSQPFYGRLGRLRNFGLPIMAAAGAVGPDLVQVALQLPTTKVTRPEKPQRAPMAHPLLLGHVLTHVVAAVCTSCGGSIAPEEWQKDLKGEVNCSSTYDITKGSPIDGLADDCEGFLKLGFLARVLQVLCRELAVDHENALGMKTALNNLQLSGYSSCSSEEREWLQACQALLLSSLGDPQASTNEKTTSQEYVKEKFVSACDLAAGAAAAYLADAGTILQLLVPGIMSRYNAVTANGGKCDGSSLQRLRMLQSLFAFEPIQKMVEFTAVVEVVHSWFRDACTYMQNASATTSSESSEVAKPQLLPLQSFRAWDWPLESVRDYGPAKKQPPVAGPTNKKSTPLLGGYNLDVQPKASSARPCVDALPPSYMDLYAKIGALKPDAERTAVCLICGEALDASGNGACTSHSYECGAGTGIFFLLQDCVGLILQRGEGSFIHSIYVDSHGETPRGRPLYLDAARYNRLRDIYRGHQVRQQVLAERESTQQGVLTGYY